ncbi:hypothetical protein [Lactiplantibacillus modestisalitolerans]|uniref:Integral membrane protein n=1 Tax=Lactiplantibacillus modestisalitolerans TaxID=1457219 RepID=A0ABV5WWA9_9LACO|nr:hypothetical protein [Lactiplantibacillus modestisalitolerans]
MEWGSIWRHVRSLIVTLVLYFSLIQVPYEVVVNRAKVAWGTYLGDSLELIILFLIADISYNWLRLRLLKWLDKRDQYQSK